MANRDTVKSNIITKNVPSVTNAILTDMLNNELATNVRFREDVGSVQYSPSSVINLDFTGKDRIDLTRTGGSLFISVGGMGDGEEKGLLITKTAGQAVSWSSVIDVTSVIDNVTAESTVYYEIRRKGNNYYAKAWVDTVKQATDSVTGVLKIASQAEANALSNLTNALVPGRMPLSTQSQRGVVKMADNTEYSAGATLPATAGQVKTDINALSKGSTNIGLKIACAANVTLGGAIGSTYFLNPTIVSGLTCEVLGNGLRRITHNIGHSNYFVHGTTLGLADTPMYFGRVEKSSTYFDVSTADDETKNSTEFDFIIYLFNSYVA